MKADLCSLRSQVHAHAFFHALTPTLASKACLLGPESSSWPRLRLHAAAASSLCVPRALGTVRSLVTVRIMCACAYLHGYTPTPDLTA